MPPPKLPQRQPSIECILPPDDPLGPHPPPIHLPADRSTTAWSTPVPSLIPRRPLCRSVPPRHPVPPPVHPIVLVSPRRRTPSIPPLLSRYTPSPTTPGPDRYPDLRHHRPLLPYGLPPPLPPTTSFWVPSLLSVPLHVLVPPSLPLWRKLSRPSTKVPSPPYTTPPFVTSPTLLLQPHHTIRPQMPTSAPSLSLPTRPRSSLSPTSSPTLPPHALPPTPPPSPSSPTIHLLPPLV